MIARLYDILEKAKPRSMQKASHYEGGGWGGMNRQNTGILDSENTPQWKSAMMDAHVIMAHKTVECVEHRGWILR